MLHGAPKLFEDISPDYWFLTKGRSPLISPDLLRYFEVLSGQPNSRPARGPGLLEPLRYHHFLFQAVGWRRHALFFFDSINRIVVFRHTTEEVRAALRMGQLGHELGSSGAVGFRAQVFSRLGQAEQLGNKRGFGWDRLGAIPWAVQNGIHKYRDRVPTGTVLECSVEKMAGGPRQEIHVRHESGSNT